MEEKEYEPPIVVSRVGEEIRIAYDKTDVAIPQDGPVPAGVPPLACRIFEALKADLPA